MSATDAHLDHLTCTPGNADGAPEGAPPTINPMSLAYEGVRVFTKLGSGVRCETSSYS
jgi:hypothetical protein